MNNLAFLQKVIEAYKINSDAPLEIFSNNGYISININRHYYTGVTIDQCIASIKESLAISYLEEIERK